MSLVRVAALPLRTTWAHLAERESVADSIRAATDSTLVAENEKFMTLAEKLRRDGASAESVEVEYIRGQIDTKAWRSSKLPERRDERKIQAIERRIASLQAAQGHLATDMPFYFEALPTPITITKTDAEGKFSLTVPEGDSLVIVAQADRAVFGSIENYYWLVRVPPRSKPDQPVLLSNDNLVSPADIETMMR